MIFWKKFRSTVSKLNYKSIIKTCYLKQMTIYAGYNHLFSFSWFKRNLKTEWKK